MVRKSVASIALGFFLVLLPAQLVLAGGGQEAAEQTEETPSINLLLISHPFVDAMEPLVPEFEEQFGIEVEMEVLAEQAGFEKLLADLSSQTGTYDLFMTSPLQNWQYISGGWVEPLDGYIEDPDQTASDYDFDDFVDGIVDAGRWTGEPMEGVGEGDLYALPINYESYLLAYRPSVLEREGITVPTTYEELKVAVEQLQGVTGPDGAPIYPIITRFDKYWDLTYLTFGSMLQSYGVEFLDDQGNVAIDSAASVQATEDFIELISKGSPQGAGAFTWYEALQGFASGQYVFSLFEADQFAAVYEDPEQSSIPDDVGYAMIPAGPDGDRKAGVWLWSMSMNSASQDKESAWQFLQWLTSKEIMIRTHLNGNMNPVRQSAWDDPEVAAMVRSWGEEEGQYLKVVQDTAEIAALRFPPHPELTRMLDIWAEAIQQSFYGQGSVQANLSAAKERIEATLAE